MAVSNPRDIHRCYSTYLLQGLVIINRLIIYLRCFNLSIYDLKEVFSLVFSWKATLTKHPCLKHLSLTGKFVLLDPYNWAHDQTAFKNCFQGRQHSDLCWCFPECKDQGKCCPTLSSLLICKLSIFIVDCNFIRFFILSNYFSSWKW